MQNLNERISEALSKEEARAELFANNVRLILLGILTVISLLNAFSVSYEANVLNFGALLIGYAYGVAVFIRIRRSGYTRMMKYITSCLDIVIVFLLLFLYTRIELASVALKHPVFLITFPLIALTAFRYDRTLTLVAGGLTVALYLVLILFLTLSNAITMTRGGYERELFSGDITYIGQMTKIFILGAYVTLMSHLAEYSRRLFVKLVSDELSLRTEKEQIDRELKIASEVQHQLIPHSFPEIDGLDMYATVEQGKFVGGDYCDFLKLTDDVLLLVIADVSGHGVPAALIMSEVHASIQLLASMKIGLVNLTERLNTLLYKSTENASFVTFFAAEINTTGRTIVYVNAGHPPPTIWAEGTMRSLSEGTIPLGISASLPEFSIHSEEFSPGSLFVSYTDGILERTNSQGEQYGEERLLEYVRVNARIDVRPFARQLFDEVKKFGQDKELEDDISLAVAKFIRRPTP